MAVPTQLGIVPLFIVMAKLGWTGHLGAVIVPGMVTAFGVFWMTQYLSQALPYELIEAARVDGCSMIRVFWHVALPAARPAAADAGPVHLRVRVDQLLLAVHRAGLHEPDPARGAPAAPGDVLQGHALIMAGVVLATIPLLVLFVVAGRQLVSGIMQGAVKG